MAAIPLAYAVFVFALFAFDYLVVGEREMGLYVAFKLLNLPASLVIENADPWAAEITAVAMNTALLATALAAVRTIRGALARHRRPDPE